MVTESKAAAAGILVRKIDESDLPAAHVLSCDLGWPHRLEDWQFLYQLGFGLGAFEGSDLVGTAFWWPQGDAHAALGMVIVPPRYQGRGIGRWLMRLVLEQIGQRSVVLNATEAGLRLYDSTGFRTVGKVRQHQGNTPSVESIPPLPGRSVRPLLHDDLPALLQLDRAATRTSRKSLLLALMPIAEGLVMDERGTPTGFALIRRFGRGHVIGPVVAHDLEGAEALVNDWLRRSAGAFIRLDVPATSGLSSWLSKIGLECVGEVTTMVRGEAPSTHRNGLFALVSQALG